MSQLTQDEVVQALGNLNPMEMVALTRRLEQEWGVSAAPVAVPQVQHGPGWDDVIAEQSEFTVILKDAGPNKVPLLKAVRELLQLTLLDAKNLVEGAPKELKSGIGKEEANEIKTKLEAAGAVVEIK